MGAKLCSWREYIRKHRIVAIIIPFVIAAMGARSRSWLYYIRKHLLVAIIIALVIAAIVLIFVESLINGTGFNAHYTTSTTRTISGSPPTITRTETYQPGKTLWDWLQLLIIPLALAIVAVLFNRTERKNEQRIASGNQHEAALQAYIDSMSELMLHENLRKSAEDDEVRRIARVRTLTTLPRLDAYRKRSMLQFLYESALIHKDQNIVTLFGANLSEADLRFANLRNADLRNADLSYADLKEADLRYADLKEADLSYADLRYADLREADLREASLREAKLFGTDLSEANLNAVQGITIKELEKSAKSLTGATMPDGTKHD